MAPSNLTGYLKRVPYKILVYLFCALRDHPKPHVSSIFKKICNHFSTSVQFFFMVYGDNMCGHQLVESQD